MQKENQAVREIIDRETRAWDTKNADLLLSIFHPDFVWFWPKDPQDYNPMNWESPLGKFDPVRWKRSYTTLFKKYALIHNTRSIVGSTITHDRNGALAVMDIDTLWRNADGNENHWLGRVAKIYTKTPKGWKLISHYGLFA